MKEMEKETLEGNLEKILEDSGDSRGVWTPQALGVPPLKSYSASTCGRTSLERINYL